MSYLNLIDTFFSNLQPRPEHSRETNISNIETLLFIYCGFYKGLTETTFQHYPTAREELLHGMAWCSLYLKFARRN